MTTNHRSTNTCQEGYNHKRQHKAATYSIRALDQSFTAYMEELERVEVFKYLDRLLTYDDNDAQAVRSNMKKARKC